MIKKIKGTIAIAMAAIMFAGCGSTADTQTSVDEVTEDIQTEDQEELDLTQLSSTVVYSEVYNMTNDPSSYVGREVKMSGYCATAEDPETGNVYYACIIPDAAACCSAGIEFLLEDGEYPEPDEEITVEGEFETYYEAGDMYCRLKNATLE